MTEVLQEYHFGSHSFPFNVILKNGFAILFKADGFSTNSKEIADELLADIKAGNSMIFSLKEKKVPPAIVQPRGIAEMPPAILTPPAPEAARSIPFVLAPKG